MDDRTLTDQMGQATGNLYWLEQDLGQANGNIKSATRNRIVGGVILLIGMIALIQFNVVIGGVILLIGASVLIRALAKIGQERRSIDTTTDGVTNARAKLGELNPQPSVAE